MNIIGLIWSKYLCKSSKQQTKINSKLKMLPKHKENKFHLLSRNS